MRRQVTRSNIHIARVYKNKGEKTEKKSPIKSFQENFQE